MPKPEPIIPLLQRNYDMQKDLKRRMKISRKVNVESANYEPLKLQQSVFDMKIEPDIQSASFLDKIQKSIPLQHEKNTSFRITSSKMKKLNSRNLDTKISKKSSIQLVIEKGRRNSRYSRGTSNSKKKNKLIDSRSSSHMSIHSHGSGYYNVKLNDCDWY